MNQQTSLHVRFLTFALQIVGTGKQKQIERRKQRKRGFQIQIRVGGHLILVLRLLFKKASVLSLK